MKSKTVKSCWEEDIYIMPKYYPICFLLIQKEKDFYSYWCGNYYLNQVIKQVKWSKCLQYGILNIMCL